MSKIIIVESPHKSKTISAYLGRGYKVYSSKGHFCDLATSGKDGLGIDVENGFIPRYITKKDHESLIEYLVQECQGNEVYLATDPDREGEAIAYHLARYLNLDLSKSNRIEFHEITKKAVLEALKNPHPVDMKMVDSQECRRMIDRILGFKMSKLMKRKIGSESAGRVQSAALLLIVNREKEILSFESVKYYEMEAIFSTYRLHLESINGNIIDSKNKITDKAILDGLKSRLLSFKLVDKQSKQTYRNSFPAFTTSTLQQDASNKLGFSPTKTMSIAQKLYEGVNVGAGEEGLITYMRTDSTRLSDEFVSEANDYIQASYGMKYVGQVKIKNQKGMQDAHEGIRPTSINYDPESIKKYLTNEQYLLYSLIYKRALASLMSSAVFNTTKVTFENTDSTWTTTGQEMVFDGYLKVYGKTEEDMDTMLPDFKLGDSYNCNNIEILEKETKPKSRFTEASIVKEMETSQIGRPSTYAQTIKTLLDRGYVSLVKKQLIPTEQGILTSDKLQEFFSTIINIEYTANMENDLDKIAEGNVDKLQELTSFYNYFMPLFDIASANMQAIYPIPTDEICPSCGKPLVIRNSKYGEFTACSDYPNCNYIKKEEKENNDVDTGIICPKCKTGHIVYKKSEKTKKYFYGCSNYPSCNNIYNDEPLGGHCPQCGDLLLKSKDGNIYCPNMCGVNKEELFVCPDCKTGHLVKRVASKGKNKGKVFYGCSNYPKCSFGVNDTPTHEVCPNCGSMMVLDGNNNLYCSKKCNEVNEPKPILATNVNGKIICSICGKGEMIERQSKRGAFFACNKFPKCKNIISLEDYNKLLKG